MEVSQINARLSSKRKISFWFTPMTYSADTGRRKSIAKNVLASDFFQENDI